MLLGGFREVLGRQEKSFSNVYLCAEIYSCIRLYEHIEVSRHLLLEA